MEIEIFEIANEVRSTQAVKGEFVFWHPVSALRAHKGKVRTMTGVTMDDVSIVEDFYILIGIKRAGDTKRYSVKTILKFGNFEIESPDETWESGQENYWSTPLNIGLYSKATEKTTQMEASLLVNGLVEKTMTLNVYAHT